MKNVLIMCVFVVAFFTLALGSGVAGKGKGQGNGGGVPDSGGEAPDTGGGVQIEEMWCADTFEIEGTVASVIKGCLAVEADTAIGVPEPYEVCGLGPAYWWGDIEKPTANDYVTLLIANCQTEDSPKYVAVSVTIGETSVVLRDPTTGSCLPLWRQ